MNSTDLISLPCAAETRFYHIPSTFFFKNTLLLIVLFYSHHYNYISFDINNIMIKNFLVQIIAELDPIFVAEPFNELDEQWLLIDEDKKQHIVEFNQCLFFL